MYNSIFSSSLSSSSSSSSSHFNKPVLSLSSVPKLFTARRFAARATYSEITAALNTLGVTINDIKDTKGFKKKYLDLVRTNHPDRGGSEEKMKDITTAFELLSNLTDFDKKEYSTKNKYSGGSSNPARNAAYQQRASQQQSAYDFQDMYRKQYESGNMNPGGGRTSSNYGTYQGQTQTNDPYGHWRGGAQTGSGETTGNFSRTMYQARRLPTSILFFRALVAYSVVVMFVVIVQRAQDDYTNQSGWAAANKQARQDRLEQIFESRQEFIDKLRDRDVRQRMEKEKQKEKRMYDYAAQRQAELNRMEFGSFPPLPTDGRLGSVFKIPADPVGILYYEPPMKNSFESAMMRPIGDGQPVLRSPGMVVSGNMVNGGVSQKQQLDPMFGQPQQQQQQQQASSMFIPPTPPSYQQQQQPMMQPAYLRNQNNGGDSSSVNGRSSPNGFSAGNFTLSQTNPSAPGLNNLSRNYSSSASSSPSPSPVATQAEVLEKQRQRTELLKQEAKEMQRLAAIDANNNISNNQRRPVNNPQKNDPNDFDPKLDLFGHEGMVAKPVKSVS